ncbi:hypothetical protein LshimejAT787_0203880 [Lyophyllum shimeji]|uniref:Uncharacterized protein n=1 Tax=Lyophyllum shimeji TaxID=47721 RepID=A0A9P3UIS4_LYOSH|nr:hypothetical protein LshimejAT787_0203880 [Lyophyllum shimeji]
MGTVQFPQDIQNGDIGAMDTTPIAQHPSDLTSGFISSMPPNTLPESALPPQLMQETSAVFSTLVDSSTMMTTSMQLAMPDMPQSTSFVNSMEVAPAPHLQPGHSGFLAELPNCDPYTMAPPMDNNAMTLDMAANTHPLSASPPAQVPSPSIHSSTPAYSVAVTSSLDCALDQPGAIARRSRANTSASPVAVPPSYIAIGKEEVSPKAEAESVVAVESMLEDIEQTAKHARAILHHRHDVVTGSSIGLLNERISQVTQKFAGLVSISSALASTSYTAPLHSPPILVHEPMESPLTFPPTAVVPSTTSSMDISAPELLSVADHPRKRCASELEEHRSVKAPKREPQDDLPLKNTFVDPPPAVATPPFPLTGITLPTVPIKPQPPSSSRPPTPPTTFSPQGSFSPVKPPSATGNFPSFTPSPSRVDFPPSVTTPHNGVCPAFPGMHSSWSDSVVPTRHHHSLSAGSLTGSVVPHTPPLATNGMADPFTTIPLQGVPTTSANAPIGSPIGRMSRSGSINGTFPSSYSFGYMEPSAGGWPNGHGNRVPAKVPPQPAATNWLPNVESQGSGSSLSPASSSASDRPPPLSTVPSTAHNSPGEEDDDYDDDNNNEDDDNDSNVSKNVQHSSDSPVGTSISNDVPQEYRGEVDRIFFEYLNKICSNLEATDSKGEPIHQTLMAKKMQRLDESPDFRPFKFRIQAFTMGFLEELARNGYPEEKIPMKKIRNYLWRQQYILRFNEDGKKAKSKGNHIWNIEAKKIGDGKWEFRPFHRKLAGAPPPVAYSGLKWAWTPRVWDPQASWQNVPVEYSSPSLPSWLSWEGDTLSGVPPPDAESCRITAIAKFVLDGQEGQLSHTFQLTVAPVNSLEAATFSRSRRPSLAGELPRRSTSDSVLFQAPQRAKPRPLPARKASPESPDNRVIRVLQSVAARVTEEANTQFVSASPPKPSELQALVKQKEVLQHTVDAYDKAIAHAGDKGHQSRRLAVAAQNVVVQAAHTVIADRTVAIGGIPVQQSETAAIKSVTVTELSDATQEAIAAAVKQKGKDSTEVDIMVAATSILKSRTPTTSAEPVPAPQQPRSHSAGTVPRLLPKNSAYPLSSVSEYGV